ncbi:MAG TPA: hypothetical protein VNY52_07140 [Solirubrobacteraceae bacterium]|jgi:hypothetical protein|nr:hypothetical protein [Solirubrobacteraceae bacterium]
MPHSIATISSETAAHWTVFGAVLAYLVTFVLPELVRQMRRERRSGLRYRPTPLTWILGALLLAIAVAAGVGVAQVLSPCSRGDAWVCGLGSISFVSGLLGLGSELVPRPPDSPPAAV